MSDSSRKTRIWNWFEVYNRNVYWEKGEVEKTWKSFIDEIIVINFLFLIILYYCLVYRQDGSLALTFSTRLNFQI